MKIFVVDKRGMMNDLVGKGPKAPVTNKDLVTKPGQNMEGILLLRKHLAIINRIRTKLK